LSKIIIKSLGTMWVYLRAKSATMVVFADYNLKEECVESTTKTGLKFLVRINKTLCLSGVSEKKEITVAELKIRSKTGAVHYPILFVLFLKGEKMRSY
jgi:hypothetical protein